MISRETIIAHTRKWITDVVVGCNFCPFAAKEIRRDSIQYEVLREATTETCLESLLLAFHQLDNEPSTETLLLIIPGSFASFDNYLHLVEVSGILLKEAGYEGIYQIAGFHPEYIFAGSDAGDAANYTNRSPYPMLHILREESVSRAIESYPGTENIPKKNIAYARQKGSDYMRVLKDRCTAEPSGDPNNKK